MVKVKAVCIRSPVCLAVYESDGNDALVINLSSDAPPPCFSKFVRHENASFALFVHFNWAQIWNFPFHYRAATHFVNVTRTRKTAFTNHISPKNCRRAHTASVSVHSNEFTHKSFHTTIDLMRSYLSKNTIYVIVITRCRSVSLSLAPWAPRHSLLALSLHSISLAAEWSDNCNWMQRNGPVSIGNSLELIKLMRPSLLSWMENVDCYYCQCRLNLARWSPVAARSSNFNAISITFSSK